MRAALLVHLDEQLPGLAVLEHADGQIALVAGDLELVVDGHARLGHAPTDGLVGLLAKDVVSCSSSRMRASSVRFALSTASRSAMAVSPPPALPSLLFFVVERRRSLGSVTINGDRFEAEFPAFDVGVHDVVHCRLGRQIDGLGDRAAEERLRRGHHPDVAAVMQGALAAMRL